MTQSLRSLTALLGEDSDSAGGALNRIAAALEKLAGTGTPEIPDWKAPSYAWHPVSQTLFPAHSFQPLALSLLMGIEAQADILEKNTRQFIGGFPANNALLWGARGTGKSSLVKAVFAGLRNELSPQAHLIEIHKEDLADLPRLMALLAQAAERRFILFLDDLSFATADDRYKNLKSVLEGGVGGQPANLVVYATSNQHHLLPRDAAENTPDPGRLHAAEAAEENISLSDRFGLWLGFYPYDQDTYLRMVASYVRTFNIPIGDAELKRAALAWSATRGARSGRVAWQFVRDLAGHHRIQIDS